MIPNHPSGLAIVARVAALYCISVELILGRTKGKALVEARHLSWWKIREQLGWSYTEVGVCLGTDHTQPRYGHLATWKKIRDGTGSNLFKEVVQALDKSESVGGQAVVSVPLSPTPPLPSSLDKFSDSKADSSPISSDQRPVSKRARGPKPRLRNVPESWRPNDAHRALAKELGVDFDKQVTLFRDHEFKDPKSNFDAAFRTWLRRANEYGQANGKHTGHAQPDRPTVSYPMLCTGDRMCRAQQHQQDCVRRHVG